MSLISWLCRVGQIWSSQSADMVCGLSRDLLAASGEYVFTVHDINDHDNVRIVTKWVFKKVGKHLVSD